MIFAIRPIIFAIEVAQCLVSSISVMLVLNLILIERVIMRLFRKAMLLLLSSSLLHSCATMFGDNKRTVRVTSNVPDSYVKVDGESYGQAPKDIDITGMGTFSPPTVKVEKDGYATEAQKVKTSFQAITLLNLLNGPLGFLIDLFTGNMMKVDTKEVNLTLRPEKS